jgi:hypothetical protein
MMKAMKFAAISTLLLMLPISAMAGDQEELFVANLAAKAIKAARSGHGGGEVKRMREVLNSGLDATRFTQDSFGDRWGDLTFRQQERARDVVLGWSAKAFAGALQGREEFAVLGSDDAQGASSVMSSLSVPGDDLIDPVPIEWIVGSYMGRPIVLDVVVAGKSSIESHRLIIESLFASENGDAQKVIRGLEDFQ